MAIKTTLTYVNPGYVGIQRIFWVVSSEEDSKFLEEASHGGGVLTLDNGDALTSWTEGKGLGDWDIPINGFDVYFAFPKVLVINKKVQNLISALRDHVEALGGTLYVLDIPAGKSVASVFKGATVANVKDTAAEYIEAFGKAEEEGPVTQKETEADYLFEIAHSKFNFYRSDKGEPFVVLKEGPQYAWPILEGTPNLGDFLAEEYLVAMKKVIPQYAIKDALNAIKARCGRRGTPKFPLNLRSAQSESTGTYWVDLGREDGKVVRLTEEGWTVEATPDADVFFRRTDSIYELPIPVAPQVGSEKEVLRDLLGGYVNVDETDWSLLVSWMVAHLIPTYIPPIAILLSSADAGKSTATMAIRYAVEGKMVKGKNMSADERDMSVTMAAERVTVFNNVSFVSKKQSDFLCDVIDRTEYEARTMRTNSGVTRLDIDSSILMNGITTGDLKGDFKTRAVVLELKPITTGRKSDNEIKNGLKEAHPRILGALFNMAARVLARAPHQVPDFSLNLRLVDYVRTVMAVDELWELHGQGIQRYVHALRSMASTAVDDLMFKVVHEVAVREEFWNGTGYEIQILTEDLRELLNSAKSQEYMHSLGGKSKRGTWETGAAVTASIRKVEPDWKRLGVAYESLGQGRIDGKKGTVLKFTFTPSDDTAWPLHYEKASTSVIASGRPTQ